VGVAPADRRPGLGDRGLDHLLRRDRAVELDVVSDTVPRLTGHPAQSLTEYLAAHPECYAHIGHNGERLPAR
jgi:hypothetical protein